MAELSVGIQIVVTKGSKRGMKGKVTHLRKERAGIHRGRTVVTFEYLSARAVAGLDAQDLRVGSAYDFEVEVIS